jgi:hypothetical protein
MEMLGRAAESMGFPRILAHQLAQDMALVL